MIFSNIEFLSHKILLNHKIQDVNIESYVKLNYKQYIELYDKWFPFQDVQL